MRAMRSLCFVATVALCLALLAQVNEARKDLEQHVTEEKSDCHTSIESSNLEADGHNPASEKSFIRDFEPRPSATAYVDGHKLTGEKSFVRDFEPRPSATAYVDGHKLTGEKSFVAKDFESKPNIFKYIDDMNSKNEKVYAKDFEPIPNISAYNDDVVGVGK
ncbi:organ-specific protein S2-like [Salvia miltiorrhiza]|uniref:organ-specific protein S2-like n=1 Tax=Salvia miltiorrhiza TaxID=226208 RepID=UPI0025AC7EF0|nr:organ-specific protein S2-like [Salvia miltiorrhiza]